MNVVCDLDGVVYRGGELIPGSDLALHRLREEGIEVYFATNNSSKTPEIVQTTLRDIAGFELDTSVVATSSQAAASMIESEDMPVHVFGSDAIRSALHDAGIATTDKPEEARAVVMGIDWNLTFERLAAVSATIRAGARFIATNVDPTYAMPGGALFPGSGALVAAVETASGVTPEVAGKPNPPMVTLLAERGIDEAWVVGDRVDTDIALGEAFPGWRSILVLSGVTAEGEDHGPADAVARDLLEATDVILGDRSPR